MDEIIRSSSEVSNALVNQEMARFHISRMFVICSRRNPPRILIGSQTDQVRVLTAHSKEEGFSNSSHVRDRKGAVKSFFRRMKNEMEFEKQEVV
jgi:hypothetical protein